MYPNQYLFYTYPEVTLTLLYPTLLYPALTFLNVTFNLITPTRYPPRHPHS